jgi:hypothetical protein
MYAYMHLCIYASMQACIFVWQDTRMRWLFSFDACIKGSITCDACMKAASRVMHA